MSLIYILGFASIIILAFKANKFISASISASKAGGSDPVSYLKGNFLYIIAICIAALLLYHWGARP